MTRKAKSAPRKMGEWNYGLPYTHKAFQPYAIALGQLALAWNGLHETLCILFSMVMGGGNIGPYLAIWHSIKVDRAQRDILLAAAQAQELAGSPYPELVKSIKWIWNQANSIEDLRNDALHSPLFGVKYQDFPAIVVPATGFGHIRAQKLYPKDLLKEFRWCRDASLVLTNYARNIDSAMAQLGLSWPDTPSLPNRGPTKKKKRRPQVQPEK